MRNFLLVVFLLTFSVSCFAERLADSDFNKLSREDQAEILQRISDKAAAQPSAATKQVEEWVSWGPKIGQAIAGAASALNTAANDFIKTPAGIIAVGLIAWKIAGAAVVHVIGGLLIFLVGFTILWKASEDCRRIETTYSPTETTWWGSPKILKVDKTPLNSYDFWALFWIFAVTIVASAITTFSW